jgi:Cys-tRNA(Pro) deacylase
LSALNADALELFIQSRGIKGRVIRLDVPTQTVEKAAQAVGTTADRIVKSLLFLIESQPVLVITPGTQRVDYKKIAKHFSVNRKRIKFADPEMVLAVTGYEVGAVPPFGHQQSISIILEESTFQQELVYAGGGSKDALLEIKPEEILRVTGAVILNLRVGSKMEPD